MTERVLGAAIIGLGVGENHVAGYRRLRARGRLPSLTLVRQRWRK